MTRTDRAERFAKWLWRVEMAILVVLIVLGLAFDRSGILPLLCAAVAASLAVVWLSPR